LDLLKRFGVYNRDKHPDKRDVDDYDPWKGDSLKDNLVRGDDK